MKRITLLSLFYVFIFVLISCDTGNKQKISNDIIDLAGEWRFQSDIKDEGIAGEWFGKDIDDQIKLPGSMTTNNKGDDISVNTPWTGSIFDSSWFFKAEYAKYREPGNIKVPFWLQPVKYYKGPAWYQKDIEIPDTWKNKHLELFIERSHWETTVWIDKEMIGMENSLATAQVFDLSPKLTPGKHRLTIRVDNRIKEINVGPNSHSLTDHTQTNWNGLVGSLLIRARPLVYIKNVKLYPDIKNKQVMARVSISNNSGQAAKTTISLTVSVLDKQDNGLKSVLKEIDVPGKEVDIEMIYPMGDNPLLWDEFHPNLYSMKVSLANTTSSKDEKLLLFGMREFKTEGTQFTINGKRTFLRGTLECAVFPLTGYPPTDVESWMKIYKAAKSYGLNHLRFHSWCPPDAAFEAADRSGFYLQIECSSWANWGSAVGDGAPVDKYIMDESERIVKDYGNHPSFCMLSYGNEPGGEHQEQYLTEFVKHWKAKDSSRLYTAGSAWPSIAENDYHVISKPRIQLWKAGLGSVINAQPPRTNYNWADTIAKWKVPVVSHEIGQWCVYPDFKEIKEYTGVLKAKNFEIFQETLTNNGLGQLADSFLLASGKLQALCYKADIEAALRTPGFGGFQLLGLYDFPGQGTALVGVLNAFWKDKGYISGQEYSRFCNSTVPLAKFPKMIYINNETLSVPVEVAHFGPSVLKGITPVWTITDNARKVLFKGQLSSKDISQGNAIQLGSINQSLNTITTPQQLLLTVSVGEFQNTWSFFVYPAVLPIIEDDVLITQQLDDRAIGTLNNGGKVLLTLKKGTLRDDKGGSIAIGFSSIFWNTAWTNGQAPHTLGILCNPQHPALQYFPTEYYSNWQWWDGMSHSNTIILDSVSKSLQPIVRVIDDWVTNRSLGLIFECRVGKGKLLVSGIDLLDSQAKRPEAKQLLFSLKKYMGSEKFKPFIKVDITKIQSLIK